MLPKFTLYMTCKTSKEKTLQLLYANVKDAHSYKPVPPSGEKTACDLKGKGDLKLLAVLERVLFDSY